jgi:hypothetical protein
MIRPVIRRGPLVLGALLWFGCTGQIRPGAEVQAPPPTMTGGTGGSPPPLDDRPGQAPLRRLTKLEYANTIRDLLGAAPGPRELVEDQTSQDSGFAAGAPLVVGGDARQFLEASEEIAGRASQDLAALLPCPLPPSDEEGCIGQFITRFGLRAFRRPLSPDESTDYLAVFRRQRQPDIAADFPGAVRTLVAAMLQSPYFLYRWELGTAPVVEGGLIRFNDYELASRLSYFFWASMPDQALFDAAAAGELHDPARLLAQARRLLADRKARDMAADFHLQWLEVSGLAGLMKDPAAFQAWSPQLAQSMLNETAAFTGDLMSPTGDGRLETLLTSPRTVVDAPLAHLYGLDGAMGGKAVTLPPGRAGILTQASFLAMHANPDEGHPFRRGQRVLSRLLCLELHQPPNPSEPIMLPERAPTDTTREHFAKASDRPCAATCHPVLNPIGFAFENFDAIGGYRTTDVGKTVDASGTVDLSSGTRGFANAVELSRLLAQAPEVRDCLGRQWLRYLLKRREGSGEARSLATAAAAFGDSSYDLRALMVAFTATRAFTHRTPSPGESP